MRENESIKDYCKRLGMDYDENEKWYCLSEYLELNFKISNYGRIMNTVNGTIYKNHVINNHNIVCTTNNQAYNIAKLLVYLKYKYMRNRYMGKVTFIDENPLNCRLSNVTARFSIMSKTNPGWIKLSTDYIINKNGEIVNKRTGVLLCPDIHRGMYKRVKINDEYDNRITIYIANIVANLFIPNPNNYKHLDYKDGNTLNCKMDNLTWSQF